MKLKIYEEVKGALVYYKLLPKVKYHLFFSMFKKLTKKKVCKQVGMPPKYIEIIRDKNNPFKIKKDNH